jgi:DNA invertase Pin-like site-specific DNA recombinase
MPVYGYARVSTLDQDLSIQRTALKAAGCSVIRAEKASGSRRDGRSELQVLLDFVQPGDTLVVTRIDRLARSMDATAISWRLDINSFFSVLNAPDKVHLPQY